MASDGEASCGSDPNFAVICSFLERFAKSCGITHPNISELQEMLENTQEVPQPLIELHVKLLRKARKSVSGERWERALIKFCHTYSSNQDGWEIERFGYKKARLGVKLRVLKTLLEQQFDLNAKFKAEINRLSAMELRCSPLGRDKLGQTYWCQLDEACNLRVYREDLDDETWEVVASDREGLVQLISQLSSNDPFRSGSEVVNEDSNSVGVDKPVTDTGQPKSSGSKDNDDHDNDDEEFQEIPSSDLEEDDSDYDSDSKHHKEDIKPSSDSKHQKEDIKPSTGNKCLKEDTECSSDSTHQKEDLKPICDIKHKKDVVQTDSENKHQKVDIKPSSGVKLEKENEKSDSDNKHKKEDITPSSGSKQEKDIKTETEVVSSSEEIATEQKGEVKVEEVIKSDAVEKQESVSIPTCTDFEKDEKLEKQICVTQDSQNNCVEKSSEKNSCREKVVADNNVILSNEDCKITENKKSDSSSSEDKQITDDGSLCITDDVPSNQTLAPSSNSPVSSKQESILDVPISDSSKKINKDVSSTSAKRSITPTNDVPAKRLRETDSEEKALEPEVSEAIEEPVMVISGEGSGKECNTGNPVTYGDSCDNDVEVSEAIEETVMFIYGEGSGKDCDTGNPVKEGDSNENEQGENGDKSDLSKKDNLSSKGAGKVSDENVSVTNSKSESLEESVCEKKLHEENCGASISQNSPSASTSSCTADISINLEGNKPHSKQEHTSEINLSTHNTHQSSTKSKSLSETVSESVTDGANKTTEMKQMNTPDHLNVTECNPNIDNNPKEGKLGHSISSEAGASETVENFDKLDVSSAVSLISDKGKALDKNYAYSSVSSMDLTKKCLPEDSERVSKTNLAQQLSVKSVPKLWSIDTICAAKEDAGNDKTELNVPTNNAIDTQTITKIAEETHKGSSVNNNSPPGSLPKCVSRWDTGKPESSLSGECLEEKNKVDEAVIAKHLNSYPNENVQADEKESKILPRNLETEVSGSCVSEPLTSLTGLSQVNPERKGVPENFSSLASKNTITQATESKDTEQSEFGSVKVGKTKPDSHSARDSGISQESPSENTEYSDRKDKNPNISISKQTGTVKASINSSGRECDVSQDRTVEIKGAQLTVEPLKSAGVLEDGVATTLESTESKIKSSLKSELISGKNAIDSEGSRADKSLTPATYDPLNLELPSNKSCAAQMPIQKEAGRNFGKEEFSQKSNKESDVLSSQNQSKLSTYRVDTHTSASSQNKFKAGNEIDSGVSIMHVPHKLSEDRILKESKYLPDSLDVSTTVIDSNKKTDIIKTTKADSETNARDHLGNISNFSAVNSSLTIEAIPLTKNSQKNCTKNSDDEFVKPLNLEKNSLVDKVKGRLVSDSISILPTTLKSRDVHTAKAQQSLSAMGKNRRKSVESITMGIMSKLAAREHQKTAQIKSIDEVMANNISDPHKIPGKINTISSDTRVIDNKDYQPLNLDKMSEKQSSSRTNDFNKPVEYQPPSSIPKKHCNLGFPPEAIHQMGLPPLPSSMLDPLRQLTNLALLSQNPADAAFLSNSLAKRFDDIASRRDVESLGLELLKKSMDGRSIDPAMALDLQMMGKFAADRKTILESQMKIPEMHLPGLEKTFNAFPPEKLNMKDATDISNLMKATDVNKLAELSLLKNFVSEPLAVKEQAWLCGGGVPLHNKADMQGHFNLPYGANAATHLYDEKMRLLSGASNTSVREKGESKRLNEEVKHRDNRHVKRTETRRELGIENIRNKSLAYYSAVKDLSNVHRDHEPSKAYPYGIPVPSRGPVAPPPKSKDSPLENLPQDLTVSSSKHGTNLSLKSPDITLKAPELSVPQKSEAIPLVKGAPYKNITIESLNDEPMAKDYSSVNSVNIKKQGLSQKFNTIPVSQNLPTQNFEKCTVPQPFQTNVADRVPENMKPLDMKLPTTTPIQQQQQQQQQQQPAAAVTPEVPKEKIHYGLKVKPLEKLSEVKLSEIVDIAKEKVPDSKSSLNEVVMCSKPETQKLDSSKTPPLEKLEAVTYPVIKPEAEKPFTNGIKVVPLERLSEASSVSDICGVKDNTPPSETVLPDTKTEQKLDKDESVIEPVSTKVHTQPTESKERSDDTITDPKNDTVFEEKCQTEVVITKDSLKNSSGASSPPSKSVPSEEDEKRKSSDQRPIVGKIQVRSFAKECKQKFSNAEKQATSEKREQSGAEKETNKLSLAPVTLSKCKSPEVKDSKNTTDQTDKKNTAQNSKPETTELVIQGKKSEPVLSAEDKTSEPKKTELSKNSSSGSAIKLKLRSRRKSPLTPIRSDSPEKVELSKDKSKTSKVAVNEESKITSAVSSESTTNAGKVPNKKSAHGKLTDTTKDKSQSTTTDMKCELITSDTQASLKEKNPTVEVIRLKIKSPRSINENLSFDFHETVKHDVDNKNEETDEPVTGVRRTRGRSGRFVKNQNAESEKTSVKKHEPSDAVRKHEPSDAVTKHESSDPVRKHEPSDADADTEPEHVVSNVKRTKAARGGRRALETRTRANREAALKKQEVAEVTSSDDGYKDNLQMRLAEVSTDDSQDRSAVQARGSSRKGGSRSKAKARARGAKAARGKRSGRGKSSVSATKAAIDSPPPSSDTQSDAAKTSKRGQRKSNVLGLDVGVDIVTEESKSDAGPSSDLPMRQSRRIAQIKIKEEAERRKIEELTFLTLKEDERLYKRAKKLENKGSKSDKKKKKSRKNQSDSDEDYTTGEHADASSSKRKGKQQQPQQTPQQQQKTNKKKKRKKKSGLARFNENNPWQSSSESSSSAEEEELEQTEEEEEEEEPELVFKSDHEFSPESDLEEGAAEDLPLRRARTARKETETEELEDKHACQKCGKSDHPEWILLCDKCDSGWHGSCLRPALMVIPEGDWFCPPCEHATLLGNLQESLKDLDSKLKRRENEELRRKRLAYVGISLDNVLPNKSEKEDPEASVPGSRRSSSSSSSSDSSSDESEPVYQLRQRRQTVLSYRYNDYDDLIYSAIQDEMEAVKGAGNQGRGKDIATIVNAEKEEQKEKLEADDKKIEDEEAKKKKKEENGEEGGDSDDEEEEDEPEGYIPPVRRYPLPKKKHRRLNSLDISSEDDADSDEDFKGSSSEEEEEEEDDADDSEDSDARGRRGRSRKRHAEPVRRSSRARVTRFDKEFINDDSDESDVPKRKRSRRMWQDSESEESDWGKKRRKKSSGSSSKTRSKKKKRRIFEDSDLESYRKKKPKKPRIKFGGLDEDEVLSRRTRGKKINYEEVAGSDTEEEVIKRSRKLVESEDEFVINEDGEEEEEQDPVIEQDDSSESEKDDEKDKMDEQDDESKGSPASDTNKTNVIKKKKQVIRDDTDDSDGTGGSDDEMQQLEEEMERLVEDDKNHVESSLENSGATESEVCPDNPSERLKDSLKLVEILEDSTTEAPSTETPEDVTPETLPGAEVSTPVQETKRKYVRKKPLPEKAEKSKPVCKDQNDAEMVSGTISEQQQPIPAPEDKQSFSQLSDEGSPPPPPGAGVQALRNMLEVPPLRGMMGMQQSFKNYMEPQQGVTPPSPQAPAIGHLPSSVPAQMQKNQPEQQQQQPQLLQQPPQLPPPPQQKPQPPQQQPQHQHPHLQLSVKHQSQLQQPPPQTQPPQQQLQPTPPKQPPQQQQQQVQPPQPHQQKSHQQIQQPPQPLQSQQPHSQIPQKQSPPPPPQQQQPQQPQPPQQKQQQPPLQQQQLQNRQQVPPLPLLQQTQPPQQQLQQQPVLHQGQPPPMQRLEAMHVKNMHNPPNVVGMQMDRAIDPPPVPSEQHIIRMSGEVQSPPKRKGRGRGKATLAAAAAAEAGMAVGDQTRYPPQSQQQQPQQQQQTPQQQQQQQPPPPQQQQQQPPHQQQQSPQPQHYAPHPSPVNSNAPGSVISRMLQTQTVSQHSPQSFTAAAAAMGHKYFGSNPDQRYAPVSPGKPGRIPSPYRQTAGPPSTSSPAMMQQHYTSRPGLIRPPPTNTAPISQPMRSRVPATQPASLYHGSHHPLDPSPSGGGPISVAPGPNVVQRPTDGSQQPAPAMAVPVATGSPLGGKPTAGAVPVSLSTPSPQPPPPYNRPRFPPDVPQAAPGAPPAPRHSFSPAAHMHAQPSPPPPPVPQHQQPPHHSLQQGRVPSNYPPYHAPPPPPPPSYHYGNYPPHPTVTVAEEGLQHSPYQPASYTDQYVNPAVESPHIQQLPDHSSSESRPYEEDSGGEFGGLVSYFSSQREDDLDA